MTERGRFIVFEGGEGTGKSTQARLLADALAAAGVGVVLTREPGGAPGAEALRRLLVEAPPTPGWAPLSEALLHYAARNEHLEKTIRPALARGTWVISDRFADSTAAYQGAGLALGDNVFDCLSRLVMGDLAPDLTFVLDLEAEEALDRAATRRSLPDRYERMDLDFHRRVRDAFIEIARKGGRRYALIDAAPGVRRVQQAVREAVRDRLGIELTADPMAGEKQGAPGPPAPRANPLLLGHEETERRVERWIQAGALPHALLISGPWGIGKSTLAFRIARSLLRQTRSGTGLIELPQPQRAANEDGTGFRAPDEAFRWIASGTHPDLLTIERKFDDRRGRTQADIVVDDVRRVGAFFSSSPAFGGWRVVVIDSADEMNRHAANALLKVLEEPNANCLLILLAHRPALVPATVRSRCRRLLLQPLGDDVLRVLMARFLPDLPAEDAAVLCELGEGSIGRILQLAKHDGLMIDRSFRDFFRALASQDRKTLVAAAANVAMGSDEEQFRVASHVLSWWLRRIARACLSGAAAVSSAPGVAPEDEATAIEGLAAPGALDHWLQVWDKSHRLAAQADTGNLDRKQVLTTILLEVQRELRLARF